MSQFVTVAGAKRDFNANRSPFFFSSLMLSPISRRSRVVSTLGVARTPRLARAVNFQDKIKETAKETRGCARARANRRRKFIIRRPVNLVRLSASLVSSLNLRVVAYRYYREHRRCVILRANYRVVSCRR